MCLINSMFRQIKFQVHFTHFFEDLAKKYGGLFEIDHKNRLPSCKYLYYTNCAQTHQLRPLLFLCP